MVYPKIENSDDFHTIIEIYCDDVDELKWEDKEAFYKMCQEEDITLFDKNMAHELLDKLKMIDFNKDEFDLVVHCRAGVSRSSATFIALNEIYNLGYENLKEDFPYFNRSIHQQILYANFLNLFEKYSDKIPPKIEKLNECCCVSELEKIDEIYHSNSDDFVLYKCEKCEKHWLYHCNEQNWFDNLRFDWDEYQEWYIGILEKNLLKVYEKRFDEITQFHGFVYRDTTNSGDSERWRKYL
jgi:hypothetical protein